MIAVYTSLTLIALILVLPFLFKGNSKYFSAKITHWLLMVYTVVLLLSLVVVSFMKIEEPAASGGQWVDIYEAASNGGVSELDPDNILVEKSFELTGEELQIAAVYAQQETNVFVESKESIEGMVKVMVLGNGPYINGMDLSKEFIPPSIRLEKNVLSINYPEFQEINAAVIKKEFTINQFMGTSIFHDWIEFQPPIIYIEVPANLKLQPNPEIILHR